MNANSHSEAVWQVLHQARALLQTEGFVDPIPAFSVQPPSEVPSRVESREDLAAKYGEYLAFGTGWPLGLGSSTPLALILTEAELTEQAHAFVRSWFENPRVNLVLSQHFLIQPLPIFAGDRPLYQAWIRDLCRGLQPKALLSLGEVPAQKVLGAPLSLDTLRGSDYRIERWSMVTTTDPELFPLLADEEKNRFKAQVWKDLQRLLGKLKYG